MGQRHNRRRTRPRSRNRNSIRQEVPDLTSQAPDSPLTTPSIWTFQTASPKPGSAINYSTECISPGSPQQVPAPTWHYGFTAWKIREIAARRDVSGLEAEQCRLFGGEPGDDVSLCHRMLEYFGGLDFIDS